MDRDDDAAAIDAFAAKDRLLGIGVMRDPHPRLHELREQCPVHQGSVSGQFGMIGPDNYIVPDEEQVSVYGFLPVEQGFRDPARFSNLAYVPALRAVIGRTILEMDPPDHQRYRALLQGAFTKKEMARWEHGFVRDIVAARLDAIAPLGRGDLATEFAFHFPITVTAVAAGLPVDDVPKFYEQAALLTNVSVAEDVRLVAAAELSVLVQSVIDDRRREPRDDLISILVQAELRGDDGERQRLTDDEIVAFMRLLVPAGAQTTYRTLTNLLFALLTHPDQLELVRADPAKMVPLAIEEVLRWEAPLIAFQRLATVDTEIAGMPVAEGSMVNLCIHSANHDPTRWDHPDEFDITRPTLAHMAFGQGNHICLGIHFARMELRVALELVLDRLPGLRLDPDTDQDVHIGGLFSRTVVHLPCVWDVTTEGVA